jgi:uncharacterized protein
MDRAVSSAGVDLAVGAEAPYWDALLAGRLALQKCAQCDVWHVPAVWRCSACGSWEHVWEDVPMRGEIFTWTRSWHRFGGQEEMATPFIAVVVKLEGANGARVMGLLDTDTPGVAIGAKVTGARADTVYAGNSVPSIRWTLA